MANRREVDTLLAVHELMRRDAGRLVTRVDACAADPGALPRVAGWFDVYRSALIQHHEVEDHLLFPAAEDKDRRFASARTELEPQHEDMEQILQRLGAAIDDAESADAGAAARELEEILNRHLELEEAAMVAILNRFTDDEFKAVDRAAARMHPLGESLKYLGWMIDGFDEPQRANFFAWQPRLVRVASTLAAPFHRRRERAAAMSRSTRSDTVEPQYERPMYGNALGLPADLVPLIDRTLVCEYASNKADGTPITTALSPTPGIDGRTIDVSTGVAYPLKAERARRDPRVCLLFSEPSALPGDRPPVALVYGKATVRDADLQRNADRAVADLLAVSPSSRQIPGFVLRRMGGYMARIWIEIMPERILWWPEGDLDRPPHRWHAAAGTSAPPSDPPPTGPSPPDAPVGSVDADPVASVDHALADLGIPILTAQDADGYPVPFRAVSGSLEGRVVHLDLHPHGPARLDGRASLTFHAVKIKNDDIAANENRTYVGTVSFHDGSADFTIERQVPSINRRQGLKGNLALLKLNRRLNARLEHEAARRGQPVPTISLPKS